MRYGYLALSSALLLFQATACERDFGPTEPFRGQVERDARVDVGVDAGAPDHLLNDVATFRDGCAAVVADDASVPASQGCSAESDWLCGASCGTEARLLCLAQGNSGELLREIRCRESGHCYCGVKGVFTPCFDDNSGRLGCVRAREALQHGCCLVAVMK